MIKPTTYKTIRLLLYFTPEELLTANQPYLLGTYMRALAKQYDKTIPQITFRFALQIGILPLIGTTNPKHMTDDLNIDDFKLSPEEVQYIENIVNE